MDLMSFMRAAAPMFKEAGYGGPGSPGFGALLNRQGIGALPRPQAQGMQQAPRFSTPQEYWRWLSQGNQRNADMERALGISIASPSLFIR